MDPKMSRLSTLARYALAAVIAIGSMAPAYAQSTPVFRMTSTGVASSLSKTSADGITVSIPSSTRIMRQGVETTLSGPTVHGNDGAGTWSLKAGALPNGTDLTASDGSIGGTPSTVGVSPGIVLGYEDSTGRKGESVAFAISVIAAPEISYEDDLVAQGQRYAQSPDVQNVVGPATYEIESGALPGGLSLDPSSGAIHGTALQLGVWPGVSIRVTDADGSTDVSNPFELEVVEGGIVAYDTPIVVKRGEVVEIVPVVEQMRAPVVFAVADDVELPAGLSLDPDTGILSGSIQSLGLHEGLQIVADDADGKPAASNLFDIEVVDFSFSYDVAPFQVNTPVAFDPLIVGGEEPYAFSLQQDALLPPGLLLDAQTGRIHGSVSEVGEWPGISILLEDGSGATIASLPIDFVTLGAAIAYDDEVVAMGEPVGMEPLVMQMRAPLAFEVVDGALPTGVTLDEHTGLISGSTADAGDFPLMVQAMDIDETLVMSEPFMLSVGLPELGSNSPDARGRVGLPFYYSSGSDGLVAPIQWESIGNPLPPGVDLDPVSGALSGTPVESGFFNGVNLRATDVNGTVVESGVFTIEIAEPALFYADPSVASTSENATISPTSVEIEPDATFVSAGAPLPDGLSVNPFNGDIEGTPLMDGTWTGLSVMVIEPQGHMFFSNDFSIVVGGGGSAGISMPDYIARSGVSFATDAPAVSGPSGPYSWTVTSGALPDGLTIDPQSGVISGVPEFQGVWPGIVISAAGVDGSASSNPFRITVSALSVSVTDVYYGRVDRPFDVALEVTGAVGEVIWELLPSTATPPDGINFWDNTGVFVGTPTTVGNYGDYTVRVTDESGAEASSLPFMIIIEDELPPGDILIDVPSIIRARPGVDFWLRPDPEGASGTVVWQIDGQLPPGLTFSTTTGRIEGQPSAIGLFDGLQIRATDADGDTGVSPFFGIDVQQVPTVLVSPDLYSGQVGTPMQVVPTHDEQVFGSLEWKLVGRAPFGMRLDPLTGKIAGTPLEPGDFPGLQIRLTDADGAVGLSNPFAISVASDLTVAFPTDPADHAGGEGPTTPLDPNDPDAGSPGTPGNPGSPPSVKLPGTTYTTREGVGFATPRPGVVGEGGSVNWQIAAGGLPPGMSLDASTGRIIGTPSVSGTWSGIYLRLDDGTNVVVGGPINIVVLSDISVTAPESVKGRVGRPLTLTPKATGVIGTPHWSFQNTGLPLGLSINGATGLVSITPTSDADIADVRFRAVDSFDGSIGVSSGTTFLIHPDIVVGNPSVTMAAAGLPFEMLSPGATGIVGTASWSAIGSLPQGLSVNPATGDISGTPLQVGTWPVRLRVTDSADNAFANSAAFNLVVQGEPPFDPQNPDPGPGAVVVPLLIDYAAGYTAYTDDPFTTKTPTVVGADGDVAFSLDATSVPLPSWLTLDPVTGALSGTPTEAGSWSGIRISAQDASDVATDTLTITARAFAVTAPPAAQGRVGQAMSFKGTAAVAKGALVWSIESGSLPAGFALNSSTGTISGTPSNAFVEREIVLRATDSAGRSDISDPISIAVDPTIVVPATYRGTVGTPFASSNPSLSGTTGAVAWSLASGTLPPWASLDPSTGRISGTPDAAAATVGLSLRGVHGQTGLSATSGLFSIEIVMPKLLISGGPTHVRERISAPVSFPAPTATGNVGTIGWSIVKGTTPVWMTINGSTGSVSASSSQPASSGALALRATDASTGVQADSSSFSVEFVGNPLASIVASASGMAGSTMTLQPVGSNIIGSRSWSLESGALPAGLSLNASTGSISGTPTNAAVGTHAGISLRVVDSHDGRSATTGMLSITVSPNLSVTGYSTQITSHPGLPIASPTPTLVNATGSTSWSIASGALPAGVTLDASTGRISGTSSQSGLFTVVVRGTDVTSGGSALSQSIRLHLLDLTAVVAPALSGTVTRPFAATPSVANAIGATTWTLDAGTLPSWASLNESTGHISGTPNDDGVHSGLRLRVVDSTGVSAVTGTFSITVDRGFLVSMTPSAFTGRVGVPLTLATPVAQNVTGAVVWTVSQGSLPQGMGLNPSTGVVSGTPTASGTTTFQMTATDSGDGASGFTPTVSVTIEDVPAISVESLYTGRMNADFLAVPTVVRANGARTWSVAGGTLPPGLSLSSSGGTISGSATQVGQWDGIALRVVDGQGASGVSAPFSIRIDPGISASISTTAYETRMGQPLSTVAPATSNVLGTASWSISGSLPSGMAVNASTGVISGTPSAAGTYSVRLQARDSRDNARAMTEAITIQVHNALAITGGKTSYGTHVDIPIATQAHGVIGSRGTVTWSLATGTLPSWASLNASTGMISGTPTAAGNIASLSLRATDSFDGSTATGPTFSIVVLDRLIISDMATNYYARVGQAFSSFPPSAAPVGGSLEWYMNTGALPAWASLNPSTGVMSGTPPAAGATEFLRLGARDDWGADERSVEFNLNVRSVPSMTPSTLQLKRRVGVAGGNISFATQSVSPNPIWSYDGMLPSGMGFSTTNGTISGTVAAGAATGSYNLDVSVQDPIDYYSATEQVQIQVGPAMAFGAVPTTVNAREGAYFELSPPSVSGVVGAASWATSASVGGGLSIHPSTGVISGILSSQAPSTATYRVTDSWDGTTGSSSAFRIMMTPAMSISGVGNVTVGPGEQVNGFTPVASNAVGSVAWSLNAGSLPSGISVNPSTGRLQGSSTASGTYGGITLRATDSENVSAVSNSFALTVRHPLSVTYGVNGIINADPDVVVDAMPSTVGASGSVTYQVVSGTLPGSMTLQYTTGRLYGGVGATPGNHTVTIEASDSSSSVQTVVTISVRQLVERFQILTNASGTWTPPNGVTRVNAMLVSGGAGGAADRGGGGGRVTIVTNIAVSGPISYTVGAGGIGNTSPYPSSMTAVAGGSTSFGSTVVPGAENSLGTGTGGGDVKTTSVTTDSWRYTPYRGGVHNVNGGRAPYDGTGRAGQGGTVDFARFSGMNVVAGQGGTVASSSTISRASTCNSFYNGGGGGGGGGVIINGSTLNATGGQGTRAGQGGTGYGAGGGGGSGKVNLNGSNCTTYYVGGNGAQGVILLQWWE